MCQKSRFKPAFLLYRSRQHRGSRPANLISFIHCPASMGSFFQDDKSGGSRSPYRVNDFMAPFRSSKALGLRVLNLRRFPSAIGVTRPQNPFGGVGKCGAAVGGKTPRQQHPEHPHCSCIDNSSFPLSSPICGGGSRLRQFAMWSGQFHQFPDVAAYRAFTVGEQAVGFADHHPHSPLWREDNKPRPVDS